MFKQENAYMEIKNKKSGLCQDLFVQKPNLWDR